jgi:predicted O-methyltransferase YrrM
VAIVQLVSGPREADRPAPRACHAKARFGILARVSPLLHYLGWRVRLLPASTQTTRAERDALATHCAGRELVVEIGVWHGVTTKRLRAVMAESGELWAVDPYPVGRLGVSFQRLMAHTEVNTLEQGRVRWIEKTGVEAAKLWASEGRAPLDFIFIDGDHSWEGISADWSAWSGLVKVGGLVALHDSRSTPARMIDDAGSVRFMQNVILKHPGFRVRAEVDSLTILERTS